MNKIVDEQTAQFERNIKKIYRFVNQYLDKNMKFTIENGYILDNSDNINKAIMLKSQLETALREAGYSSLIQKSLIDNREIYLNRVSELQKKLDVKGITAAKVMTKSTINSFNKLYYGKLEGVKDKFIVGITDKIYNNVMLGQQYNELLTSKIKALENFKNEALTQMRTIKSTFIQKSEDEIAETIGFGDEKDDIWEYTGAPLQDNSHPECVWALNDKPHAPYFTNEEKIEFENGGGYEHTEPRWNCQHYFAITDLTFEDYEKA